MVAVKCARYFPFEPLERLIPRQGIEPNRALEVAEALGVSQRAVFRYRKTGLLPATADRLACHIGICPENVWEAWLNG